ncbi:MAG: transposase [Deltaproteobacteria bacterium]|nr:MAG: transposase [Deltaproteobacteria bacterium]
MPIFLCLMALLKLMKSSSAVNHSAKAYADNDVHSNTAESYLSILERARIGVFHYMSHTHLPRYLDEASFRWSNRTPKKLLRKRANVRHCGRRFHLC